MTVFRWVKVPYKGEEVDAIRFEIPEEKPLEFEEAKPTPPEPKAS